MSHGSRTVPAPAGAGGCCCRLQRQWRSSRCSGRGRSGRIQRRQAGGVRRRHVRGVDLASPRRARLTQTAADVAELSVQPDEPSPTADAFRQGHGVVAAVDRTSRVGVMRVAAVGLDKAATVAIQIGPVIRGTALRDASGFIQFSDFVNQFDFASAANALNDSRCARVIAAVTDRRARRAAPSRSSARSEVRRFATTAPSRSCPCSWRSIEAPR